jgi:Na+(H+)/acetate symporter ActP
VTAFLCVAAIAVLSTLVGARGGRVARTTSDFLVASRSVSSRRNALAISGEYLSAASFLGTAGLVLKDGMGQLWYQIGFTAGFLVLLVVVAGPLRRFGSYTVPEFAEGRLESSRLRRLTAVTVLVIAWIYLVSQLKGAGTVLRSVVGTPYWIGVALAGTVLAAIIIAGGMRSVTSVQSMLYIVKLVLLAVPAVILVVAAGGDLRSRATRIEAPVRFLNPTTVSFPHRTEIRPADRVEVSAHGSVDGQLVDGPVTLQARPQTVSAGSIFTFPAGSTVPSVGALPDTDGPVWAGPAVASAPGHPVFDTYSLLVATALGTMGLPHVLARFSTSPDGRGARRAAVIATGLIAAFYLFPPVYGLLGRVAAADLRLTGATDTVVIVLPRRLLSGGLAVATQAMLVTGAFAAFLSTSSGLLMSLASALSHDITRHGVRAFRNAAAAAALVAVLLAVPFANLDISFGVTWALSLAAATLCPLLALGIWWPRLTAVGAAAGLVTGLVANLGALAATLCGRPGSGWGEALVRSPAGWAAPLAFLVMVAASLLTRRNVPASASAALFRMHVPLGETSLPVPPPRRDAAGRHRGRLER